MSCATVLDMDLSILPPRIARRLVPAESGCLRATGSHNAKGYATVRWEGENRLLHRVVWTLLVGPISGGLTIDHVHERGCIHKDCQLVDHMELVTAAENSRRTTGLSVRNLHHRAKTHCPQGHPYDEANTYWHRGCRQCLTCRRARTAEQNRVRSERRG